jgi:translation initiation factor 2B subunit (eIF-2B alpha/beta/delta family)
MRNIGTVSSVIRDTPQHIREMEDMLRRYEAIAISRARERASSMNSVRIIDHYSELENDREREMIKNLQEMIAEAYGMHAGQISVTVSDEGQIILRRDAIDGIFYEEDNKEIMLPNGRTIPRQ